MNVFLCLLCLSAAVRASLDACSIHATMSFVLQLILDRYNNTAFELAVDAMETMCTDTMDSC